MANGNLNHIGGTLHVHSNQVISDTHLIIDGDVVTDRIIAEGKSIIISIGTKVQGDIQCGMLQVIGELQGNVTATERIQIEDTAVVVGDIKAPKIDIAYRARFQGHMSYM